MRLSTLAILLAVVAVVAAAAVARRVRHSRSDVSSPRFAPGDRVRVGKNYHWAKGATGTVQLPPTAVSGLAEGWRGAVRSVQGADRVLTFYWVAFDAPQRDADGDGPYAGGEIQAEYLEPR